MKERELGKYEKALARVLREKVKSEELRQDSYVCMMLALIVDREDPEENCKELYEFLQKNPDATIEDIWEKQNEILGVYIDEEDFNTPYYDDEEE